MSDDLFISYAWTTSDHREWVRFLAANLKALGYDVLVDADVDYGDSLNGFMRRASESRHVLLVVDENYVDRSDNMPESGVGIESRALAEVYDSRPGSWMSVLFRNNPACKLPSWLVDRNPKGVSFNAHPATDKFPGSEQVDELWRWMENLPANRDHAVSARTLRDRAHRLEELDRKRDPNAWANPAAQGEVEFPYSQAPNGNYRLGHAEYAFTMHVSGAGGNSIYAYNDYIHSVGLNRSGVSSHHELAAQLTPGRTVTASKGEQLILQNNEGVLCLVDVLEVQAERTAPRYSPALLRFRFKILLDS
ncbi:hypothetical protein CH276_09820 [Rhodococcus sp. 06-470-2]|uniref:toll/interleukin-1 receptor domain-containing protein n=1 Tax=unclassified Rhodococcus (in: high G+C Gram-positive bacteria) TaxID=192944 RepID=UPI000B9AD90C|nr:MULTISPECIES: toll/interleukin-1 receptor domain-containing protein [unclassified Rhodococcus (in: high G+C Gram-positive bacteria)]OZC65515.1 hypothetical protein CH276_09820 [Rhodococcus sp. 06-470-2]OZE70774.1 hypothetical protein CH265_02605 [Rhodococcus sp. 05-2221-1B]